MDSKALETLTRLDMGLSYIKGSYNIVLAKDEYIKQLEKENEQLRKSAKALVDIIERKNKTESIDSHS